MPDGVGGKLDVIVAKGAGHFQEAGADQSDGFPAKRAGDFPAKVLAGELDFSAAPRAEHLHKGGRTAHYATQEEPCRGSITSQHQIVRHELDGEARGSTRQAERVGEAAKAGALRMTVHQEQGNAIDDEIGGQPGQANGLKANLFPKQTHTRNCQFNSTNQQHGVAQRNAQHGFRDSQGLRVPGGSGESDQRRKQ